MNVMTDIQTYEYNTHIDICTDGWMYEQTDIQTYLPPYTWSICQKGTYVYT